MSGNLDKSLEDIIKEKRATRGRGGRGGGRGNSIARRSAQNRFNGGRGFRRQGFGGFRNRLRSRGNDGSRRWGVQSQQFRSTPFRANYRGPAFESRTKVIVDGLNEAWGTKDILEIFTEQGYNILNVYMHWDRSGRSMGKCDVTFGSLREAEKRVRELDGALVDGCEVHLALSRGGSFQGPRPFLGARRGPVQGGRFGGFVGVLVVVEEVEVSVEEEEELVEETENPPQKKRWMSN